MFLTIINSILKCKVNVQGYPPKHETIDWTYEMSVSLQSWFSAGFNYFPSLLNKNKTLNDVI